MIRFKDKHSLEQRKRQFEKVMAVAPSENRYPIIFEPSPGSRFDQPNFSYIKILCAADMTVGGLQVVLRKRLDKLSKTEAIYFLVGTDAKTMCCTNQMVGDVYEEFKDAEDGFLYITFAPENTFG